jgi:phosphoenolpyruvate carboxykinase (ATP)
VAFSIDKTAAAIVARFRVLILWSARPRRQRQERQLTNHSGILSPSLRADQFGLDALKSISYNLEAPQLYEEAIRRGEAAIAKGGALVATTGAHTGRSPKDKFIVRDALTERAIWWDNSSAITPAHFDALYADMRAHAATLDLFGQDLYGGAEPANRVNVRVYTEYAWHSLFIRNLLIRPSKEELQSFIADLTILDLPSFAADPARHGCRSETVVAIDFSRKIVLIGGTSYAGEIKKSVFSYLNFVLPPKGVMPMHCSANVGRDGVSTLFFGLSGTGKTTLSADASRTLIGDDEHGWSPDGIFNFEGGCYAKAIRLSKEAEPEIFSTTERFGSIMENVVLEPLTRAADFNDASRTENTRIAYPLDFIANASTSGRAGHPKNIVMLTCDAFGVLPPIARLDPAQAMFHFLSGYTAKVAGTEKGVSEPQATFSTCFGAPFMSRHPSVYGNLLRDLVAKHDVNCWLVNTGWTGGKYGVGQRMPIRVTRALLTAALDGSLANAPYRTDPFFGLSVPLAAPGVEPSILNPVETWSSPDEFARAATNLVEMFRANFVKFAAHVDAEVVKAQPAAAAA